MMWSCRGWALLHTSLGETETFRLPLARLDAKPILFPALTCRSWGERGRSSSLCDRASWSATLHSATQLLGSWLQGKQLITLLIGTGLKGLSGLQSSVPTHNLSFQKAIETRTPVTLLTALGNIFSVFHAKHRSSYKK